MAPGVIGEIVLAWLSCKPYAKAERTVQGFSRTRQLNAPFRGSASLQEDLSQVVRKLLVTQLCSLLAQRYMRGVGISEGATSLRQSLVES